MFTVIGGVVNDIGFMNSYELTFSDTGYKSSDLSNINGEIQSGDLAGGDESLASTDTKMGVTSLLTAIKKLDDYVFIKTIIMDIFANKLVPGSPEHTQINNIANIIQSGCIFVYLFAIVQLWRNSSIKHME